MDAGIEQFHHILPPLSVAATFHIRMGQLIHNHDLWVYAQNSIEIHLFHLLTFVEHLLAGDDGQPFQRFHRVRTAMRLHIAYPYVRTLAKHLTGILQHPVGFAHPGYHADVDLEPAPMRSTYQVEKIACIIFHIHIFLLR